MGLGISGDLISFSGIQGKNSAVFELSDQLAFQDQKNVSTIAPVIRKIAGRVFNLPDSDFADLESPPKRLTAFA